MKKTLCIIILLNLLSCNSEEELDLPIEDYKKEIRALSSKDYYSYWKDLIDFDQNVVLKAKSVRDYDSLSIVTLIKSALFYELKGDSIFKSYLNPPNEILFIHNSTPKSNLDFWPILMKQKEINGTLLMYPSYQLEGIAGSFYDYSVFGQDSIYDGLLSKLNSLKFDKVSYALIETYKNEKRIKNLKEIEKIGAWNQIRYKNQKDFTGLGNFELVKMSNDNYYFRIKEKRLKQLEVIIKNDDFSKFKTKNEPFDWTYKLSNNGDLRLLNDKGEILINYKIIENDNLE